MFPVVGWAVPDTALAPATTNTTPHAEASSTLRTGFSQAKRNSKKRKRDEVVAQSQTRLTGDELQRLWDSQAGPNVGTKNGTSTMRHKQQKRRKASAVESRSKIDTDEQEITQADNPVPRRGGRFSRSTSSKLEGSKQVAKLAVDQSYQRKRRTQEHRPSETSEKLRVKHHGPTNPESPPVDMSRTQLSPWPKLTPLQAKMRGKLTSARFRHLNELLYTTPSSAAMELFTSSPDLFSEYHEGFSQQVKTLWPENPVDDYVVQIRARSRKEFSMGEQSLASASSIVPLPRRKTGSCTIADLGCGDAQLASAFSSTAQSLNLKFHNFDLHAPNKLVQVADIANLPLRDGEIDVAIFCLSLMGTNWISFIEESWRILRGDGKGEIWIAEVKSRFGRRHGKAGELTEANHHKKAAQSVKKNRQRIKTGSKVTRNSTTNSDVNSTIQDTEKDKALVEQVDTAASAPVDDDDDADLSTFIDVIQRRGFTLRPFSVKKQNKMFVSMIFTKSEIPSAGKYKGLKWNGHEYKKAGTVGGGHGSHDSSRRLSNKKFGRSRDMSRVELEEEEAEEAKVLKPCLYKKR